MDILKFSKHKWIFYVLLAFVITSCGKENLDVPVETDKTISNLQKKSRTIEDVKVIIAQYKTDDKKSSNALLSLRQSTKQQNHEPIEIKALTSDLLNSSLKATFSTTSNFAKASSDTLLFFIKGNDDQKSMLVSANLECEPVLAIFDKNFSLIDSIQNNDAESIPFMPLLLSAIEYNQNPDLFVDDDTTDIEHPLYRESINTSTGTYSSIGLYNTKTVVEEIVPRVKVEWGQSQDPYNRYTPNNYPAGCVATVIAQAMSVTRHIGNFNNIPLNWDNLIKMKNSGYRTLFPNEATSIGLLLREIGYAVGMDYGASGSSANTKKAVKRLFDDTKVFYALESKGAIHMVLRESPNNVTIISSRTKKSSWLGFPRGEGHAYIVDGYQTYSDGSDLLHVNFGWDGYANGYVMTRLWAPYFTDAAVEKFPYEMKIYNIRKRY